MHSQRSSMLKYAQDSRSDSEYRKDYDTGQHNEEVVYNALNYKKYKLDKERFFGDIREYAPDCFLFILGYWTPIEIKTTWSRDEYQDFKRDQVERLAKIGGSILFATPFHYSVIPAAEIERKGIPITADQSRVNKSSYRTKLQYWRTWSEELGLERPYYLKFKK